MARRAYRFAPAVDSAGVAGRISIVVVHYRGAEDLSACVASVWDQDADVELVIVDNGSPDGAVAGLAADPRLVRQWLPRNLGFAAGANAGIARATGDVVVLLNPDATLRPGCLAALAGALGDAHVAVPRVLLADDPDRLDSCGHALYPDGLNWCRGRGELATGRYEEPEDVLLFSGAAVAFRRESLALLGGLDEGFWAYGEDADLSLRAARLGLRCRTVPEAVVVHRVGGSFGRYGLRKAFLVERNRIRVALVHLPVPWLLVAPLWTAARVVGLGALGGAGRGVAGGYPPGQRAMLGPTLLAAWGAGVLAAPGSIARRMSLTSVQGYAGALRGARIGLRTLLRRPAPEPPRRTPSQTR